MSDDLRERVARAMCDAVNVTGTWEETGTLHREKVWFTSADAAIAIIRAEVLEDAAKAAERIADIEAVKFRDALTNEDDERALRHADIAGGAKDCAAAIRAMKEQALALRRRTTALAEPFIALPPPLGFAPRSFLFRRHPAHDKA